MRIILKDNIYVISNQIKTVIDLYQKFFISSFD